MEQSWCIFIGIIKTSLQLLMHRYNELIYSGRVLLHE